MAESIYRVTEVIVPVLIPGRRLRRTLSRPREDIARSSVGEIVKFDVTIEKGKVTAYRARVNISSSTTPEPRAARVAPTESRLPGLGSTRRAQIGFAR